MKFECNRPYESWYGTHVDFPAKDVQAFFGKPVFWDPDPGLEEFRQYLRCYLDALKNPPYSVNILWPKS
jgi:hypothetical protein